MDRPLSGVEVMKIAGEEIGFCLFSQMEGRSLESLFVNDKCLINYLSAPMSGHWVGMSRRGNEITYFNPSGNCIDESIWYLGDYGKISNQDSPHLLKKIIESNYKVRYAERQMQADGTKTCGRWCGLWFRYGFMGEEAFQDLFQYFDDDEIIVITDEILSK